jgi:rfaE bifunctional protein nucleotidyltransferase chain/domain
MAENRSSYDRKYVPDMEKAKALSLEYKKEGKKIVFTNGCFDIIHRGHVAYLEEAKSLGNILIIGVNSDESIRTNKGDKRPIVPLIDRLHVLAALESVDHVVPFANRVPDDLIRAIRPDIHTKGGDYTVDQLAEAKVVREVGGEVVVLTHIQSSSTTSIIEKVIDVYGKK